jgi:hypothetical protein
MTKNQTDITSFAVMMSKLEEIRDLSKRSFTLQELMQLSKWDKDQFKEFSLNLNDFNQNIKKCRNLFISMDDSISQIFSKKINAIADKFNNGGGKCLEPALEKEIFNSEEINNTTNTSNNVSSSKNLNNILQVEILEKYENNPEDQTKMNKNKNEKFPGCRKNYGSSFMLKVLKKF